MVLKLWSGTSIHALHLAKRGYEITGLEISAEMLEVARARIEDARPNLSQNTPETPIPLFLEGDIRTTRLQRTYDAVIAIFHVMSYQTSNEDVSAAFATVREHLTPGGVFLFDFWYGPAVLTETPSIRIKRIADECTAITRIAEPMMRPNENLVEVH